MPSDNGIAFYNSQMMTSVTPITDFQNQIAVRPAGEAGGEDVPVRRDVAGLPPS